MSNRKPRTPSDHGIVVDHKELKLRYAVSDENFDEEASVYVRDLRPGETLLSFQPKPVKKIGEQESEDTEDLSTNAVVSTDPTYTTDPVVDSK